jgi:hypothetical protein
VFSSLFGAYPFFPRCFPLLLVDGLLGLLFLPMLVAHGCAHPTR